MPAIEKGWHGPDCPGRITVVKTVARGGGKGEGGDNRSPEGEQRAREPRKSPESSREEQGPSATAAPVTATAPRAVPTAPKDSMLIARLNAYTREASHTKDPLAYFAAVVQTAYTDSGYAEPSDHDARELVIALANTHPEASAVERVLDSISVVPSSKKGASGGKE